MTDQPTIPRFGDERARDKAYAEWVAEGNTMVDCLMCSVAGRLDIYRAGAWVKVFPS